MELTFIPLTAPTTTTVTTTTHPDTPRYATYTTTPAGYTVNYYTEPNTPPAHTYQFPLHDTLESDLVLGANYWVSGEDTTYINPHNG